MLGYGKTDKPEDPKEYSLKKISDDLKSILDEIEVSKAVSPVPEVSLFAGTVG